MSNKRLEQKNDFTSALTSIFRRVENQLDEYDKIEVDFQNFLSGELPQKIRNRLRKVKSDLSQSEVNGRSISNEVDLLNRWLRSLEEQKKTILQVDNDILPNNIARSFGSNAKMLKEMEIELLEFIRKCVDSYKTPAQIRLTENFKVVEKRKSERLKVWDQLSDRAKQLDAKLAEVQQENKNLTIECARIDEILRNFSTSSAFEQLQKAKKQRYIIDDWKNKRIELLDKIDTAKTELLTYKEDSNAYNNDKSQKFNLMRKAQEIDNELEKKTSKYNDQIQNLQQDLTAFTTHQQSMMKQLENDLVLAQFQGISAEKKKTAMEVKSMKGAISRSISKYTTNKHQKNRQIEISLKKKGLLLKDSYDILQKAHSDDIQMIKTSFESLMNDLRNIINMRNENNSWSVDSILKRIEDEIELARATTENAKVRINHRNVERNIELKAVNDRLVTVQGVVDDISRELPELEKKNTELTEILQNQKKEKDQRFKDLRKDLESNELIVNSVQFFIDWFKYSIIKKIDKADDDVLFTKKFKQRALKRSKSQTRLHKLTKSELLEWMNNQFRKKPSIPMNSNEIDTSSQIDNLQNDSNENLIKDETNQTLSEEELNETNQKLSEEDLDEPNQKLSEEILDEPNQKFIEEELDESNQIEKLSVDDLSGNSIESELNQNENLIEDDLIESISSDFNEIFNNKQSTEEEEENSQKLLNQKENDSQLNLTVAIDKNLNEVEPNIANEINQNAEDHNQLNEIKSDELSLEENQKSDYDTTPIAISPPPMIEPSKQSKPKRKIIQISQSAASLCPTIAIIDTSSEEEEDQKVEIKDEINQIPKFENKPVKKFDSSLFNSSIQERSVKIEPQYEEMNVNRTFRKNSSKSEERFDKVENNPLSYAKEPIIKYKSENNLNQFNSGEKLINGRLLIDYDKSLTENNHRHKKKASYSFTYKKSRPKPIPNDEPSFVHKRSPRHVVFAKTANLKTSEIRKISSTNSFNVNVVDMNSSIVGENHEEKCQPLIVNVNEDVIKPKSKTGKKKKKYVVKKKSKADDKKTSKKSIKLANDILNFSLPTAERRKAISQNGITKNGNAQLKKRISGNIFSIHPL